MKKVKQQINLLNYDPQQEKKKVDGMKNNEEDEE